MKPVPKRDPEFDASYDRYAAGQEANKRSNNDVKKLEAELTKDIPPEKINPQPKPNERVVETQPCGCVSVFDVIDGVKNLVIAKWCETCAAKYRKRQH